MRNFAKSLKPPLKLSLPALETLAVIAYKHPGPLHAADLHVAADLQTLQRLAFEVDRVVAQVGARPAAGEPDGRCRRGEQQHE